jgi:hypothetical protein
MVSVAETQNGNTEVAGYIRQIQACLTYIPFWHLRQVGGEEVESWRHVLYQVLAEALQDWLNRYCGGERWFSAKSCRSYKRKRRPGGRRNDY